MFIMENVGRKIAELRKERNMTQMELADKMGISFQAVSNWERGNSMPDISKLPELAELFGVTIDGLLGEDSKLVENVVSGDIKKYLEDNEVTAKDIGNIAPILKPNQMDEIAESIKSTDLRDIEELLPFLSRSMVDDLALKAAEEYNYNSLDVIAPFVSKNIINDIALKMIKEDKNIADIAPFVDRSIICELADSLYQSSGPAALDDIAPFIPHERLVQIAEEEYANKGLSRFGSIAPFLDREYLNSLARKTIEKDGIKALGGILPFVGKDVLAEYVKEKYL